LSFSWHLSIRYVHLRGISPLYVMLISSPSYFHNDGIGADVGMTSSRYDLVRHGIP
jgi:hypothetical protein